MKNMVRAQQMADLFRSGQTYEQVGRRFGVSRQRVQQVLKKTFGITSADGGFIPANSARKMAEAEAKEAALDKYSMNVFGCTREQFQSLKDDPSLPLEAYRHHRYNAHRRGIPFRFRVWDWWSVWQESGHWCDRGKGHGYVMCRKGDEGAYEPGNVFIATQAWNAHDFSRRGTLRPIGVLPTAKGLYAVRVGHSQVPGAIFGSPSEAVAAYVEITGDQSAADMLQTAQLFDFAAIRRWRAVSRLSIYGATYRFGVTRKNWLRFEEGYAAAPRSIALVVGNDLGINPSLISPEAAPAEAENAA